MSFLLSLVFLKARTLDLGGVTAKVDVKLKPDDQTEAGLFCCTRVRLCFAQGIMCTRVLCVVSMVQ